MTIGKAGACPGGATLRIRLRCDTPILGTHSGRELPMLPQLWTQLWPLLIALAVIAFFFYKGRGKIEHGNFTDPTSVAPGEPLDADNAGLHRSAGTTDGVAWTVEVLRLASEVDDGVSVRRSTSINFTRWTAPHCKSERGSLLLMNLPKGQSSQFSADDGATGLMAQLKAQGAMLALQLYVRQRFGAVRAAGVHLEPTQRVQLGSGDFGSGYAAWSNDAELSKRLTPTLREWLVQHHDSGVAALWDAQGLTLHWLTPTVTTDDIAASARVGAELVNLLQRSS